MASYAVSGPTAVKVTPDKLTPAPRGAADDWKDCFRRISPVAVRSGEGRLKEQTPAVQPRRRERVKVPLSGRCLVPRCINRRICEDTID
jgi:hypothetical protein